MTCLQAAAPRVRQVSENQCHMCMPIGAVAVFKGIENAMVLVHGSQGCSTYMRLANVEHYNEPVDIASSSLNEKQAIYGGEANLRKAMDNVIRVYQPTVLGILTTCLSETMGEDLERIVTAYVQEKNVSGVDIIPVNTPSYSGTQSEGFWAATRGIIAYYVRPTLPHRRINVIVPHISPADIREIKRILDGAGLSYTLVPDYSMTLDRPYGGRYQKIPPGGATVKEIVEMSGAPVTIQFGTTCPDTLSPGLYLEKEFGVPLVNLPLPIGLKNMDLFVETITKISGQPIPDALMLERGWLLDGMADSHKFNAEGRPVIYGEPELVYAFATLCAENGATPVVIASGTKNSLIAERLNQVIESADEKPVILEGADIAAIEESALCAGSNIAIGHSGGKSLTERHGIPLVRIGFPIHDRIGGQRILSAGYRGTLAFLDRFTNTLLETKYATYRQKIKEELCTTRGS
ncbi:nitrogenase component 1 [Methanoregula sp.]|uniref:nitrogenase component 1 n=1 Tax=Methanoregula sp. TaxID=2052170 RepID=UPI002C10DA72|nr:nitrogenase component 1 [Methanoregula sp.]HVP96892.1 nitrogenase component 1 [Methanoregula sp.]